MGVAEAAGAAAAVANSCVLLLVNDDSKRRALLHAWRAAGFDVEAAATAREALEWLKGTTPALIVIEDRLYRPKPG